MKRIIGAALSVALATGAAACSDKSSPSGPDETTLSAPPGTLVSNALVTSQSVSPIGANSSLAVSASRVAYVSAVPGTFPQALSVSVRNQTTGGASKSVEVSDGGFDPVGIDAEADNELSITAVVAGGGLKVMTVKVPVRRPPGVVRTSPGKGRIDVALNVQVLVVFSEPVQPSSVTSSSFGLRRDGNVVSGKVQVSADGLSAEFIPDSPLQPETTYELAVDKTIRDLDGDVLDQTTVVPFTTSKSEATGAIEVSVSTFGPDQDADGYVLSAQAPSSYQWAPIAATATYTLTGTEPGSVSLLLYGLAANCTLVGANPQIVNVKDGATTTVRLVVNCVASGSLRVTTVTTGEDLDADGYYMRDRDRSTTGSDIGHSFTTGLDLGLPSNGTVTASALPPGQYVVGIQDIAPNCEPVVTPVQTISVVAGVETSLRFEVRCVASTQIAFVRGAGDEEWIEANIANKDIYLVNSNGTGTTRLTSSPGADINPAWSPDGGKLAFASDRAGNREIYVMNADGTDPVRLTNHGAADYLPAYSPDGKRIAFVSERDGNAEIYLMNADGTNVLRLTTNAALDTEPAWSPDGSRIAFARGGNIYVMSSDGSGANRLTQGASDMQPSWSPDAKTIAFSSKGRGYNAIYLMNADGSQIRQILGPGADPSHPDWSPNGRQVAFDDRDCWDNGPCPRGILIGTVDGLYSTQINDAAEPAWRPR